MPEGPSIIILKEAACIFKGKRIISAEGSAKTINIQELVGQKLVDIKSWGKHFLICLPKFTIRIHLMMFGSYTINERKETKPRLTLIFADHQEINFYACSVRRIDQPLDEIYDWSADVMNEKFDTRRANAKLRGHPTMFVCDAILDQQIFAGAGNIFKNEVLYRIRIHPLSKIGALPDTKRRELVREVVQYGKDFLQWKKAFVLRKHWLAHTKKTCVRDGNKLTKAYLGETNRRSFYCEICQRLYQ
jgi:endonuclease-8